MPQSNGNLMTQFSHRKGYKGIRAIKTYEFLKDKKKRQKNVLVSGKTEKQYVRQIIYYNERILSAKVSSNVDFADKPVVHCHIPVVKKIFAENGK